MSEDFHLSEIPELTDAQLSKLAEEHELGKAGFESLRSLCASVAKVISIEENTEEFKAKTRDPKYGVLLGHVAKCIRLSMSILELSSKGKHGETIDILAHQIKKVVVQALWLSNCERRLSDYLDRSLDQIKKAMDQLKLVDPARWDLLKDDHESLFKMAGYSFEDFVGKVDSFPSPRVMLDDLGLGADLVGTFLVGINGEETRFPDLTRHYLEEGQPNFRFRHEKIIPKSYLYPEIGMWICKLMENYCSIFSIEEVSEEFTSYFSKFESWLRRLHEYILKNSLTFRRTGESPKASTPATYTTPIKDHHWAEKKLLPPFLKNLDLTFTSWRNDRLPEMLWAMSIIKGAGRDTALEVFRKVYSILSAHEGLDGDITFSGISRMPAAIKKKLFALLRENSIVDHSIKKLLVLRTLPGRDDWTSFFGESQSTDESWNFISECILAGFDHQSQESTDCRWLRVLSLMAVGRMNFPSQEMVQEILDYPNFGDMRKVRPSIRANEGSLDGLVTQNHGSKEWLTEFWKECFEHTTCILPTPPIPTQRVAGARYTEKDIELLLVKFSEIYLKTIPSTTLEAKHDSVWGLSLYILEVASVILKKSQTDVLGTLGLRLIAEALINLSYLLKVDDAEIWKAFRDYGIGQAKLVIQKSRESSSEIPAYLPVEELNLIANEDRWEEFVAIDVGDWADKDLRKRSEVGGTKDIYDGCYVWPSNHSHASWAAIRSTVFGNCLNPLHRFHRLPRSPAQMKTVRYEVDAIIGKLVEKLKATFPDHKFDL